MINSKFNNISYLCFGRVCKKCTGHRFLLQLEGFINDYFYRRNIKDPSLFGHFDAYVSVHPKSIVVYVYPKETLHKERIDSIKKIIKDGLQSTLFDWPDLEWTKEYSFDVVIR